MEHNFEWVIIDNENVDKNIYETGAWFNFGRSSKGAILVKIDFDSREVAGIWLRVDSDFVRLI